jgi:UDP-2,3-diacylglucosamine pyrophosphatase LpxH
VTSIRWICISDLHLGALNSLLTSVTADGEHVDVATASPVLAALGECLRALRQPGSDVPELIVLGDLFELALTSREDAAGTFAQFISAVRPGLPDAAIAPTIRFVPGNHDHHLWSRAVDDRYLNLLEADPSAVPGPADRHATHLLPANDRVPVRDRLIEILARRGNAPQSVTVEQSYPNLGLVTDDGHRAVILSHGHFVEPLYRMMSLLDTVFGSPRLGAVEAWQLEADNGGWIDFFWSSMGDSGDIMRVTRTLYESLQSHEAMHAEIAAIERAIKAGSGGGGRSDLEAHAVAGLLRACVGTAVRERHRPGITLSPHAEEGLLTYLNGAVATQTAAEIGHPDDVTFIFGHTHKPFIETRVAAAFASPVKVLNTGGWVVDTPQLNPFKGASLILIDEELNVAALRCYTEGPDPSSYRLRIDPADATGPNALVDQLRAAIDPDAEPWATLAKVTQSAVVDRGLQLADRLRSDASMLNQLHGEPEAGPEAKN